MNVDKKELVTIVSDETTSISAFLENLQKEYKNVKDDNIVLDIMNIQEISPLDIVSFLEIAKRHQNNGKSFVIVSDRVSYEDVPEQLNLVPSLLEAQDLIEMEEIERDLGF